MNKAGPDDGREPDREDDGLSDIARAYQRAAPYLHIGWTLAASVLLGTFGGWWLDKKLGTEPLLLIIGAVAGMAAGFIELIRTVSKIK